MSQYVCFHESKFVIKTTKEDDSDSSSINLEDMYMSTLAQSFWMQDFLSDEQESPKIQFYLPQQFTINTCMDWTGIVGDYNIGSGTFRTNESTKTALSILPSQ